MIKMALAVAIALYGSGSWARDRVNQNSVVMHPAATAPHVDKPVGEYSAGDGSVLRNVDQASQMQGHPPIWDKQKPPSDSVRLRRF
jgi:hypothetical protein